MIREGGQVPAERAGLAAPACHYRGKELQPEKMTGGFKDAIRAKVSR